LTQCRGLLEASRKGGVVSQGATRRGKDNPGSCRKRPSGSTECSRGHGRVQTFQYKRTSSKHEGASTDMYKAIRGSDELGFPSSPIPKAAIVVSGVQRCGKANTNFCSSHSRLSSGHTFLVLSQREMQWKWKACCKACVT
jgi:hypothetical protein